MLHLYGMMQFVVAFYIYLYLHILYIIALCWNYFCTTLYFSGHLFLSSCVSAHVKATLKPQSNSANKADNYHQQAAPVDHFLSTITTISDFHIINTRFFLLLDV